MNLKWRDGRMNKCRESELLFMKKYIRLVFKLLKRILKGTVFFAIIFGSFLSLAVPPEEYNCSQTFKQFDIYQSTSTQLSKSELQTVGFSSFGLTKVDSVNSLTFSQQHFVSLSWYSQFLEPIFKAEILSILKKAGLDEIIQAITTPYLEVGDHKHINVIRMDTEDAQAKSNDKNFVFNSIAFLFVPFVKELALKSLKAKNENGDFESEEEFSSLLTLIEEDMTIENLDYSIEKNEDLNLLSHELGYIFFIKTPKKLVLSESRMIPPIGDNYIWQATPLMDIVGQKIVLKLVDVRKPLSPDPVPETIEGIFDGWGDF